MAAPPDAESLESRISEYFNLFYGHNVVWRQPRINSITPEFVRIRCQLATAVLVSAASSQTCRNIQYANLKLA